MQSTYLRFRSMHLNLLLLINMKDFMRAQAPNFDFANDELGTSLPGRELNVSMTAREFSLTCREEQRNFLQDKNSS